MKRDMVLIRRILIEVESWKNQGPKVVDFNDEQNKIGHHVALLHQAGFLEIYGGLHRSSATGQLDRILVKDMTWEGHLTCSARPCAVMVNEASQFEEPQAYARGVNPRA